MLQKNHYIFDAMVIDIYDGDTWTLDIDLGLGTWLTEQDIRLYGIDTPEIRGRERPEGLKVAAYCQQRWIGQEVVIQTFKAPKQWKGKFGRWLGTIFVPDLDVSVNQHLIEEGMASEYLL